jgi:hypothetical protein
MKSFKLVPVLFLFNLLTSCGIPYYLQKGNNMLVFHRYDKAFFYYRQSFLDNTGDQNNSCLGIYGYLYTTYEVLEKKRNNLKILFELLGDKDVSLKDKVRALKKVKRQLEESENYLKVHIPYLSYRTGKKECRDLNACSLCNYNLCKIDYLILKLDNLKKKNTECSYRKFVETFNNKDRKNLETNFDYHAILALKNEIETFKRKYSVLKDSLVENYLKDALDKSMKYQEKNYFLKSYKILEEASQEIDAFPKLKRKYKDKLEYAFKKLYSSIRLRLENLSSSCNSAECKIAAFLYSSLFYVPIKMNYDRNLIEEIRKDACVNLYITSNDEDMKSFLQKNMEVPVLINNGNCNNTLKISVNSSFKAENHEKRRRNSTYYSSLPAKKYRYIDAISELYGSTLYSCSHCRNPQMCLLDVKNKFRKFLSETRGLGFSIPYTFFDTIFELNYAKTLYSTLSAACINYYRNPKAYTHCIEKQRRKINKAYYERLKSLCNWIKKEYRTRKYNTYYTLKELKYEEIEKTIHLTSNIHVYADLFYEGIKKHLEFDEHENKTIDRRGIRIIKGNYKKACEYERFYSRFGGKPTKCIKPKEIGNISVSKEKRNFKYVLAKKISERILKNCNPIVLLEDKLKRNKSLEIYAKLYIFYPNKVLKDRDKLLKVIEKQFLRSKKNYIQFKN